MLNRQIIGIREYYGVNITHKTGSCEVLAHIAMKYIRPGLLSKNAYRGSSMGRVASFILAQDLHSSLLLPGLKCSIAR